MKPMKTKPKGPNIDIETRTTTTNTSISERLSPQDLADDGCPHSLDLCGTGLEYERVL